MLGGQWVGRRAGGVGRTHIKLSKSWSQRTLRGSVFRNSPHGLLPNRAKNINFLQTLAVIGNKTAHFDVHIVQISLYCTNDNDKASPDTTTLSEFFDCALETAVIWCQNIIYGICLPKILPAHGTYTYSLIVPSTVCNDL